MHEALDSFIGEILEEYPQYKELAEKTYTALNDNIKNVANLIIESPFSATLKQDLIDLANAKDLPTLEQNLEAFISKYPIIEQYKDEIQASDIAMNFVKEWADKVIEVNNEPPASVTPTPIINPLYNLFISKYPEFKDVEFDSIIKMFAKIGCIYPKYKYVAQSSEPDLCDTYPFFMLVGHYLAIEGKAEVAGSFKGNGVVASSSIDGVSVSYATPVYKDNFQYFFTQTPYGQEYLAYLSSNNAMIYINNAKTRV